MEKSQETGMMEVLSSMEKLIYSEQCAKTIRQITGKNIIIFLGNTRSGKSTIVNFVAGNKLRAVKTGRRYTIEAIDRNNGPVIGATSISETTIPTAWSSTKINSIIVDAPGFDDNRGEAQDVANAFYIKELITNANSVKFALVCDIYDILLDNINPFISLTDKMFAMLPHCGVLQSGVALLFNKSREAITREEICIELQQKVIQETQIKFQYRCLIEYLVKKPMQIVIMNTPEGPGELKDAVFNDLVEVIRDHTSRLSKVFLTDISPSISDKSRVFLLTAHNLFTEFEELDDALKAAEVGFQEEMDNRDFNLNSTTPCHVRRIKKNLLEMENKVNSLIVANESVTETLLALSDIIRNVRVIKNENKLYTKLKFVSFVDQILNIKESDVLVTKVKLSLSRMKDIVVNRHIEALERLMEISTVEANQRRRDLKIQMIRRTLSFHLEMERLEKITLDIQARNNVSQVRRRYKICELL